MKTCRITLVVMRHCFAKSRCRRLGQENVATAGRGFEERLFWNKRIYCTQYMVQFFNEYNQELTMIKRDASPIAKSVISQLDEYNFTLPIKHLDWTHNLVLVKQIFSLNKFINGRNFHIYYIYFSSIFYIPSSIYLFFIFWYSTQCN